MPSGFHLFPELVKLKSDRRFGDPLRLVQDFRENLLACFRRLYFSRCQADDQDTNVHLDVVFAMIDQHAMIPAARSLKPAIQGTHL